LMAVRLGALPEVVPTTALTPLALPGVLMPCVAATILTVRAAGRSGLRELYGRLLRWRVGWVWLPVVVVQPVVLLVAALLYDSLGTDDAVVRAADLGIGSLATSAVFLLVASTGEEVGWRGLALPALQAQGGPLRASIVLGLVTATWHLPYWVLQGVLADYGAGYLVIDYVFVLALTFQLTWLVNHGNGSVLVAVVFHVVFNLVNVAILPVTASVGAFTLLTALECLIALALVARLKATP
jgi:CAAX protease family protein